VTLLVLAILSGEPTWKAEGERGGMKLESAAVEGTGFLQYRATGETSAEVGALCDAIFEWASTGTNHPYLVSRQVLEDHRDWRTVYDRLDPPLLSHRDLTFVITRRRLDDGRCEIEYHAQNDRAPKLPDGYVRIEKLQGAWLFERRGAKTHVTYTLFADPGGSVPALLVNPTQRDAVLETLATALALPLPSKAK
jgi:hypothetical protein